MNEQQFIKQFEELTLPPEQFNHRGHLWLAWIYLKNFDFKTACQKINEGIKSYAESLGANQKYHFTLTTVFIYMVRSRFNGGQDFEAFLKHNNDLLINSKKLIDAHYSNELINSEAARKGFVGPDKLPFPIYN